jgi:phosphohistidine phosphatase SixA
MKKLVIARHGSYGHDDCLDDFGKKQIRLLAEELKKLINGDKVVILSSTAERARQSAEILAEVLVVEHQLHELLWSDCDHPHSHQKALELVRSHKEGADIIILVTHLEYGEGFPSHFGQHELEGTSLNGFGIQKCQAWIIDCQAKKMDRLAPVVR